MSKSDTWFNFYEPYIKINDLLGRENFLTIYIENNYQHIIVEQYEQYKDEGKRKRAGEFVQEDLGLNLKNPDAFYNEIKRGVKKDITNLIPILKEFPVVKQYLSETETQIYRKLSNIKWSLELGYELLYHPECATFLLSFLPKIFPCPEELIYFRKLNYISNKIKDNLINFNEIGDEIPCISLSEYEAFLNISDFKTEESVVDLYIKKNYSKIMRDQYKQLKPYENTCKQESFIEELINNEVDEKRSLFHRLSKGYKKMDNNLLERFREFPILQPESESLHSNNIKKLNYIRFALYLGAIFLEETILLPSVTSAVKKTNSLGLSGIDYLRTFSVKLEEEADELEEEYEWEENQIRLDKYYSEDLKI